MRRRLKYFLSHFARSFLPHILSVFVDMAGLDQRINLGVHVQPQHADTHGDFVVQRISDPEDPVLLAEAFAVEFVEEEEEVDEDDADLPQSEGLWDG